MDLIRKKLQAQGVDQKYLADGSLNPKYYHSATDCFVKVRTLVWVCG